jgi:hypothetical protein
VRVVETLMLANDLKAKLSHSDFREVHAVHLTQDPRFHDRISQARDMVEGMTTILNASSMYFVKAEMTDLITFAGERLDEDDVVNVELAPTKQGFVYFEKPVPLSDLRGTTLNINALLWHFTNKNDLVVYMWNDQYRTPDPVAYQLREQAQEDSNAKKFVETIGRWGFVGMLASRHGQAIGKPFIEQDEYTINQYETNEGFTPVPSGNLIRVLHAYWLLMDQTLVKVSDEHADRKLARTMKRFELPSYVTVMQYRRTETIGEFVGESSVEWSHRWIVRGHWRWQPFKNEKGQDDRKRIWIAPFMKGPEDKPLVLTDKIYALTR